MYYEIGDKKMFELNIEAVSQNPNMLNEISVIEHDSPTLEMDRVLWIM